MTTSIKLSRKHHIHDGAWAALRARCGRLRGRVPLRRVNFECYSNRRATIGSTRVARKAGGSEASRATARNTSATPAK